MSLDCAICIKPYTKTTRRKIKCPFCNESSCMDCIKTFFKDEELTTTKCMFCKTEWDDELLRRILPISFSHNQKCRIYSERTRMDGISSMVGIRMHPGSSRFRR